MTPNPVNIDSDYTHVSGEAVVQLNLVCEANEAIEIRAVDTLDFFPPTQVDKALEHWLSRLAHGGIISIVATEIREVARGLLNGAITLDQANQLLYGTYEDNDIKCCALSMDQLCEVLVNKGLKILRKRIENYKLLVVAQRP